MNLAEKALPLALIATLVAVVFIIGRIIECGDCTDLRKETWDDL